MFWGDEAVYCRIMIFVHNIRDGDWQLEISVNSTYDHGAKVILIIIQSIDPSSHHFKMSFDITGGKNERKIVH